MSVFLHCEQGVPVILVISYDSGSVTGVANKTQSCADGQLKSGRRLRALLLEWLLPTIICLEPVRQTRGRA